MPFDPDGTEPDANKDVWELHNFSGFEHSTVTLTARDTGPRLNVSAKRFSACDFRGSLKKASFTNCEFLACYTVAHK
jgi:hypothetical protein